jgi:hypothetical protein
MTTPAHPSDQRLPGQRPASRLGSRRDKSPLGVAAIGYAFMGKAHSNAWRNVASFFDVPAFEQKVLVGRDAGQVAEAAAKYGWAESATDWRSVIAGTTSTSSISAPRAGCTPKSPSPPSAAGKHVLVEKPLANTLAEAEAMTAAAAAARAKGRAVHDRIQLPPRPRPGPGPGTHRRRPARHRPARPRRLPAGLAFRRRIPHDLAPPQGNRRAPARWATSPPTPSTKSCSSSATPSPKSQAACTPFTQRPGPTGRKM